MATRHAIVPKGRTLDRMHCDVCHKPVEMWRDKDRARHWKHRTNKTRTARKKGTTA